jgi:sigma-B regulation protein RsbU (phosphoserine phosphatase)
MEPNTDQVAKNDAELHVKKLQLHWLLQITKAINYNLPSSQLFGIYETVMRDQLQVSKLVLYIHEDSWQQMLSFGLPEGFHLEDVETRLGELNQLQFNNVRMPEWVKGFESIIPVYHNDRALAYAFIGEVRNPEITNLKEVLPFIHTVTNIIVVAIENKRLTRDTIRQAQMQRELELAARMQSMLFPVSIPHNHRIDLLATYLPHQQVGGDYYDYIPLNDDEVLICLADVSGKGISAALLMSNFQANLNAKAPFFKSLESLAMDLNGSVNSAARGEKYITVFLGLLNTKTHLLHYVNAGHNPPFIVNGSSVEFLETGTTGLGMFPELPFVSSGQAHLLPGSILFCYTDGIVEQESSTGEPYGLDRFVALASLHADAVDTRGMHKILLDDFQGFKADTDALDDVTLLTCRCIA